MVESEVVGLGVASCTENDLVMVDDVVIPRSIAVLRIDILIN